MNEVKENSWSKYINSSYIVDSLNQNNSKQYLDDYARDGRDENSIDMKSYSFSLNNTSNRKKIPPHSIMYKNEQYTKITTSSNLNGVVSSSSSSNPLDLIHSTKNETAIRNISPIMTHPDIFKKNRGDFYTLSMPLQVESGNMNTLPSFPSPQYKPTKTTVSLPISQLSSYSISTSQQP
ncbi:hypothetical protein BCR36DRAFT_82899 [Piromyces finnis]|uniref:Uncharacterized protein n=1 Tax=Piromyces finnis TaxID=1754191 RepID=A0A1Y1V627_9FUNG|nr:hypothetical protein BCR36DRAFT_82899 [Piromyces finnis]|eukprot:ORX48139.1 hypothetical protein BCR36DRAFT_82899 [Piromyces finnis]